MTYPVRAFLAACVFAALAVIPARADGIAAFTFTSASFATFDTNTAELGYDFTTGNTAVAVTALGYINDGFNGTHTVALFDVATKTLVAGGLATVTTVGGGGTSTTFTYTNLTTPVELAANTEYQIVSQFFANEHYSIDAAGLTSPAGFTLNHAVYDNYGAPPATPTFANGIADGNNPGDFGPNLEISTVPELSSIYLVASGLFSFGVVRLRRS
jgi:hypothetical protein